MKYFQVRPEFDQRRTCPKHFLVANELYTTREMKRLTVPLYCVTEIHIPETKVYWCFGVRFAFDEVKT